MSLFKRKPSAPSSVPAPPSSRERRWELPDSTVDWSDVENIRKEWDGQLEGVDQGLLGWGNGMHMYDQGPVLGQRMNVAEYMTRALGYDVLDQPILTDEQAAETCRRVLTMIETMPSEPAWPQEFAPRLARLALAVTRKHRWQPTSLGGDGQVTEQILSADRKWIVWNCVRSSGIVEEDAMTHCFRS